MNKKIKTSIVIDKDLWDRFKSKVVGEKGLKGLSKAVEEAIEEELCEDLIVEALEGLLGSEKPPLAITPVESATKTDAGKVVRELRDSRL
jgi:acyl-CoA synthetase (AMP-forming)/AMP-acid ligase II